MNNVLLIDLSSIAHPLWHMSGAEPDPNWTATKIVERVRALATGVPHVVVCRDSGKSFRKDVDPEYKANRPESDAVLHHQIALAVDTLKADGFPVWAAKGFEADDIIATVANVICNASPDNSVTIATSDKDLLQLVNDRVVVKSLRDGSLLDTEGTVAKFNVRPEQIQDYLALVGDVSDNVKGAKGVGAVTAAKLLQAFGNLDDLYAAIDKNESKLTAKLLESLTEFRARMPLTRELIGLRFDVPLPLDELWRARVPADAMFGKPEPGPAPEQKPPSEPMQRATEAMAGKGSAPPSASPAPAPPASETASATTFTPAQATVAPALPLRADAGREQEFGLMLREPDVPAPAPGEWTQQLEPRSMAQAKQLAADLFASRLFSQYGNPPAVLAVILAGRELGMQAMASLRGFFIVEGKPTLSADLIRALVTKSGKATYFRPIERTATRCTFETKRGDDPPVSLTYTIEEAQAAGLVKKGSGWEKAPADMLVARASTKLARLIYADVVFNLYDPSEIET